MLSRVWICCAPVIVEADIVHLVYARLMQVFLRQYALFGALCLLVLSGCTSSFSTRETAHSQSASPAGGVYAVRRGDTLFSIAWQRGLDYQRVAEWNSIRAPYTIYPGQKIRLYPPGNTARSGTQASTPRSDRTATAVTALQSSGDKEIPVAWHWPATGPILRTFDADSSGKKGISIGGTHGNQIRAAAGGRVVYAGSGLVGYGRLIILKHNDTYLSAYGHSRDVHVQEGDLVRAGQVIASMGSTGTNRIQLHFEIRRNGKPVDPLRYLPRR